MRRAQSRLRAAERHLAPCSTDPFAPPDITQFAERDAEGEPLQNGRPTKFGESAGWFFEGTATSAWEDPADDGVAQTIAACRADPDATPDPSAVGRLAATVRTLGFVVLRQAMPVEWVDACHEAFMPRLMGQYISKVGANDPETRVRIAPPHPQHMSCPCSHPTPTQNRGPFRHYMDLPFVEPFVQLTSCRVAIAVMRELLGPELACERLASDTPLGHGSVYQAIHADGPGLTADPDGIPTQGAFVSCFRLN